MSIAAVVFAARIVAGSVTAQTLTGTVVIEKSEASRVVIYLVVTYIGSVIVPHKQIIDLSETPVPA